jgi:hypothetical protein
MLKYIGGGAFIPDLNGALVPARDLTDAEVAQFGERALVASGLYASKTSRDVRLNAS